MTGPPKDRRKRDTSECKHSGVWQHVYKDEFSAAIFSLDKSQIVSHEGCLNVISWKWRQNFPPKHCVYRQQEVTFHMAVTGTGLLMWSCVVTSRRMCQLCDVRKRAMACHVTGTQCVCRSVKHVNCKHFTAGQWHLRWHLSISSLYDTGYPEQGSAECR